MPIRLYNSLTGKKEEFVPKDPANVTMYACGPTVYAMSHIGHARSAVSFDVISRYLRYSGFRLTYARNYTDVDDKIINRANEEDVSCDELAERYIKAFDEDMASLGVLLPDARPRATQTIGRIIALTSALIEKGFAYASGADVFYSVRKKKDYGKLSGKNIDELEAGARVDVNEAKADPLDFALWKGSKPGEPAWNSPWGMGRPGWHIECSAMCMDRLGETIDIHGGGRDLIFPHHENEIAQSEAYTGKTPFARYWLHNGFVNIAKEKMSKSLGNILNIRDALTGHTPEAIRLFLLSSHYRSPIDYTQESLKDAENAVDRLYKTIERVDRECPEANGKEHRDEQWFAPIIEAMDDDFNTAMVIGLLFKEVSLANRLLDEGGRDNAQELSRILSLIKEASGFLGVFDKAPEDYYKLRRAVIGLKISPDEIERLISERNEARKTKDFKRADEIRRGLLEQGVVLEDAPDGTKWSA
ncbi:MAG: cysteine--tRNA ligase [Deltaproteobacteria bacterium]|nr:cysteine--tRNA ligase [Deltaproteobacteria bacterium]